MQSIPEFLRCRASSIGIRVGSDGRRWPEWAGLEQDAARYPSSCRQSASKGFPTRRPSEPTRSHAGLSLPATIRRTDDATSLSGLVAGTRATQCQHLMTPRSYTGRTVGAFARQRRANFLHARPSVSIWAPNAPKGWDKH